MARHKRLDVLVTMKQIGLVPVFYHPQVEIARQVVQACVAGGAKAVEFTNRGDRAINVFTALQEFCAEKLPEAMLGVGSVVDAPTAAMYIAAGADFVVGPVLDADTARLCNCHKVAYMPGCGSATEIHEAHKLGVEICKVFPGEQVGGPEFVKAVRGPCPWTEIMPTGGVSPAEDNLRAWFTAGIACAGIGSNLITKELLKAGDFAGITAKVKETVDRIASIRKQLAK